METLEKRATISLALLFSLRMLGLFMILPVFSPYAHHLSGTTPFLIGVALGIYGLTQGLLQIPFGTLSDYFPRKWIIAFGFGIFLLGSIIAARATSIEGVILGRALQGAGAVGSAIIALLTDLTREENRSKALAVIGIIIGASFFFAMLIGPILNHFIGVSGIFWLTAALALLAIIMVFTVVPTPLHRVTQQSSLPLLQRFRPLLRNPQLISLDIGIFSLHAILMASFVIIPLFLHNLLRAQHGDWVIYAPTMLLAIVFTFILLAWAEKTHHVKALYFSAIIGLLLSTIWLGFFHQHIWMLINGLIIFFTSFNVLEANLPSLVSRSAPPSLKGTAIGIYSTCQYSGVFMGGLLGGWLYGHTTPATILFACAIIAALWLVGALLLQRCQPAKQ
jgi:MFS family permease